MRTRAKIYLILILILITGSTILFSRPGTKFFFLRLSLQEKPLKKKISAFKKFSIDHPSYSPALLETANAYRDLGTSLYSSELHVESETRSPARENFELALGYYDKVLELDPDFTLVSRVKLDIYKKLQDTESIIKTYEEIIKNEPLRIPWRLQITEVLMREGRIDEAMRHILKGMEISPEDPDLLWTAGKIYLAKNELPLATYAFRNAAFAFKKKRKKKEEAYVRHGLGICLARQRFLFESLNQFNMAIKLYPDWIPPYIDSAHTCLELGLFDKALMILRESPLGLPPWSMNLPEPIELRIRAILAETRLHRGEHEKALSELRAIETLGGSVKKDILIALETRKRESFNKKIASKKLTPETDTETAKAWNETAGKIRPGDITIGTVKDIRPYGTLIELESGITAILRPEDLSWTEEVPRISTEKQIEVKVLEVLPEEKRVYVGIKQLTEDPWNNAEEFYPPGSTHKAVITDILADEIRVLLGGKFPASIAIGNGPNKLSIKNSALLSIGDNLDITIDKIDPEKRSLFISPAKN